MAHSTLKAPTTSTLPWEKSLQIIATSLTGPVAQSLGLIGLFVAGGMLIFGGELADWARRVCWVILAFCVMVMASDFITVVFPSMADEFRPALIRRSMVRPRTLLGAERSMMAIVLMLTVSLAMPPKPIWMYISAGVVLVGGTIICRQLAKVDPMLSKVFGRWAQKKTYYTPVRSPWAPMWRRPKSSR
ncbi:unnamed protein product [Cyprideis torosa]|uniref:Uncharacterized protein n=1 Tax=Cyprideis torosa TaxID=163714 RepID=A0A7R8WSH3_9CRUS|nr:unnamed protein product [Cyprideis torosa]CAG0909430.1 unnamed protein product [Cyprideis torosa]